MSAKRPTYPASLLAEARKLSTAGWTPTQIMRLFQERGIDPTPSLATIQSWTNPKIHAGRLRNAKRRNRRQGAEEAKLRLYSSTPEYLTAFVLALADAQVPVRSIVKVLGVVTGEPWNDYRVEKMLAKEAA